MGECSQGYRARCCEIPEELYVSLIAIASPAKDAPLDRGPFPRPLGHSPRQGHEQPRQLLRQTLDPADDRDGVPVYPADRCLYLRVAHLCISTLEALSLQLALTACRLDFPVLTLGLTDRHSALVVNRGQSRGPAHASMRRHATATWCGCRCLASRGSRLWRIFTPCRIRRFE